MLNPGDYLVRKGTLDAPGRFVYRVVEYSPRQLTLTSPGSTEPLQLRAVGSKWVTASGETMLLSRAKDRDVEVYQRAEARIKNEKLMADRDARIAAEARQGLSGVDWNTVSDEVVRHVWQQVTDDRETRDANEAP